MKKTIITLSAIALTTLSFGQKLELTEAAVAYKPLASNPMWFGMKDQIEPMKAALKSSKKAIDESWALQQEKGSLTKSKDLAKLNYYRGVIYLDYTVLLASVDETTMNEVQANEEIYGSIPFQSLKESMKQSSYYKEDIEGKIGLLRSLAMKGGIQMYEEGKYEEAYGAFVGAIEMADIVGTLDTTSMFNAGLAADNNGDYDNAVTYYAMAARNDYTKSASPYQSLFRALDKKNGGPTDETMVYLKEAKEKYPNDIGLSIEEFNYYNAKGDAAAAQASLEKAIAQDPENPIYQYSIGTTFDKMANELADQSKYEEAQIYIDKAKESYQTAIDIDPKFSDAYYNMGVLYNNESYNISEKIKTIADIPTYDAEKARAKSLLKEGLPFLEKAHELSPSDPNALTLLKTIYFTLEMEDKYQVAADKLKGLGE